MPVVRLVNNARQLGWYFNPCIALADKPTSGTQAVVPKHDLFIRLISVCPRQPWIVDGRWNRPYEDLRNFKKVDGMRFCVFLATLCICGVASGQLFAAAPELNFLHPAGVQRGETVTVEAGGKFAAWPPQIWTDRPGITVEAAEKKGELKISTSAKTLPGLYWIRLYNAEGASAQRPFVVGTLPEQMETEPNNDYRKPQEVAETSVIINGRLNGSNDVDTFAVKLAEGQTLVASMTANEVLGSPMDAVLEITSTAGFRLAYNHDTYNLDPQIVFTAPAEGTYLVRTFALLPPNQSIVFQSCQLRLSYDADHLGVFGSRVPAGCLAGEACWRLNCVAGTFRNRLPLRLLSPKATRANSYVVSYPAGQYWTNQNRTPSCHGRIGCQ